MGELCEEMNKHMPMNYQQAMTYLRYAVDKDERKELIQVTLFYYYWPNLKFNAFA